MDSLLINQQRFQLSERERSLLGVMGAVRFRLRRPSATRAGRRSRPCRTTTTDAAQRWTSSWRSGKPLTANARAERVEQLLAGEPKRLSTYIEQCSGRAGSRDRVSSGTASSPSMTECSLR